MSRKRHSAADEPHFLIRTLQAQFRDGQALAALAHDWGQLIYCASGVMTVWTAQGSWVAPQHWAVWAPARVAHAMRFTGAASLRTLYLRPTHWPSLRAQSTVITVSPLMRELILRAVDVGMLDDRDATHVAIAELIVSEMTLQPAPALDLPLPQNPLLRRVAEHIAQAPSDRNGHRALAQRFGIGVRTLERRFLDETGIALGRWRRQARFLQALRTLGAGASVKQAALDAGYQSASAFIAAFRAALNTTPSRYFERDGL